MIIQLSSILENLSHWCEACPCHFDLLQDERGFRSGNRKRKRGHPTRAAETSIPRLYNAKAFACPLRGKRLPELVAEGLMVVASGASSKGFMNLLIAHKHRLTEQEWNTLLADFQKGKQVLELEMKVKLDFCRRVPWLLALLIHEDQAMARRELAQALFDYEQQPVALREHHHPLTRKAFDARSPLRAELNLYLSGVEIDDLPQLSHFGACFRFVQITERYFEASHSVVKRKVPPNSAGPMVSLCRRLYRLAVDIAISPAILQEVAHHFDVARNLKSLPTCLGLAGHPSLHPLLHEKRINWKIVKELNRVLYRIDLESQFPDVHDAALSHKKENEKLKNEGARLALEFEADQKPLAQLRAEANPPPGSYEHLRVGALQNHMLAIAAHDPTVVFRLQVPKEKLSFVVTDLFQTRAADESANLELLDDVSGCGVHRPTDIVVGSDGRLDEHSVFLFFQIVHSKPANRKIVPVSPAVSGKLSFKDIAVNVFNCPPSLEGWMVCAPREGDQSALQVMHDLTSLFSFSDLCQNLAMVTAGAESLYLVDDSVFGELSKTLQASRVITKLLEVGAYQDLTGQKECFYTFPALTRAEEQRLADLLQLGLVEHQNGSAWRLTAGLLSQLRLCKPMLTASQIARSFEQIHGMPPTVHELWCRLEDAGFEWRKVKPKEILIYEVGGPKIWGTRGKQVHLENLQCLLQAEDLRSKFGVVSIPCCQPRSVYIDLLEGKQPEQTSQPALQLLDDVVAGLPLGNGASEQLETLEANSCHSDPDPGYDSLDELVRLFDSDMEPNNTLPMLPPSPDHGMQAPSSSSVALPEPGIVLDDQPKPNPRKAPVQSDSIIANPVPGLDTSNYTWGAFRFTFKKTGGGQQVSLQATCPFHARSASTGCKKSLNITPFDSTRLAEVTRLLKHWCIMARNFKFQRTHMAMVLDLKTCPEEAVLEAKVISASEKPDSVKTDQELDQSSSSKKDSTAKSQKPKAKAASAKPKGKSKEKKKPAPELSKSEAGSGSSAESSSTSSSSTSDSSSGSSDSSDS